LACEVLPLRATTSWQGAGIAIIEAVERIARTSGCDWL
jgi:hypothetical protein